MDYGLKRKRTQEMIGQPVPGKKVGIIRLEMVRERRSLYGKARLTMPKEAVETVRPMLERSDREMMVVMSLSAKMEPLAVEIAAVGGTDSCYVDVKSIFKHPLLNNAVSIICFHNHPSGDPAPSESDYEMTERVGKAGKLLGIDLTDHIIIGMGGFFSFREQGLMGSPMPEPAA